jgi:predicted acylesterase/phospholipase RssA
MEGTIFTTRTPGKLIYRNNSPEAFSDKVVPGPAWRWEARKATGVGEGVRNNFPCSVVTRRWARPWVPTSVGPRALSLWSLLSVTSRVMDFGGPRARIETLPGPTRHCHHDDRSVELHHAFMCSCALAQIAPPFAAAPKALPGSIKIRRILLKLL